MSSWFRSTPESEALLAEERLVLSATEMVYEAMERAGVNKQELAEMLDVQPSEVSQRLSGRRNLTLRTLARMLHVLGKRAELNLKPALPALNQDRQYEAMDRRGKTWSSSNVIFVSFDAREAELDPTFAGYKPDHEEAGRFDPRRWAEVQ
jgi:plasmid maintenance system antidote protein VapI